MRYGRRLFVWVLMGLLAGCSSVLVLRQPRMVPVFVRTFEGPLLKVKTKHVPCVLNLVNCAREATLVKVKFSGGREPGPVFPIRDIIRGEFAAVISANFRDAARAEQAKVELKVEARKVLLERSDDDLSCEISLAVHLLNPQHVDKPYFSKAYLVKTGGVWVDDDLVPWCVYEAVQNIADRFVQEVNADSALAERLSQLSE